jgi:hypothetical protein
VKKYLSKIIAQDVSGLQMISALVADAEININEIKYLPQNKIFLLSLKRAEIETENKKSIINSIIKFDFINSCKSLNISSDNKNLILKLLTIDIFKNNREYQIRLLFDKNRSIELISEIIECQLEDQNKEKDD